MKETEHPLKDHTRPALAPLGASGHHNGSAWPGDSRRADDTPVMDDRFADHLAGGLANAGFIATALRRTKKVWCTLAVAGLAVGVVLAIALPSSREAQARTSILIGNPPGETPATAMQNDQGLMRSHAVAGAALRKLGLRENPASFLSTYTTSADTNQIMSVTVRAPSAVAAVREANTLASAFIAFQAQLLTSQQGLESNSLQSQASQAQHTLDALEGQIGQLSAEQPSPEQGAELAILRAQGSHDSAVLTTLQQTITADQVATTTVINGTRVLDPAAPVPVSAYKRLALYGGGGLLGGLVVGMGIAIIGALASGRLRRRDDVARALGAPVRLSVSRKALSSVRPRTLVSQKDPAVQQIVAHLQSMLSPGAEWPATLAVVPVGQPDIPALCLASFAVAEGRQGRQVVLADLSDDAPAARLLGVAGTGVQTVTIGDVRLTVAVPEGGPTTIVGPLAPSAHQSAAERRVADACASADLLVTLASLDPSSCGDHLRGWADRAVPMVTAGRSSAARIYAVGEMIRLAGLQPVSAVLLGADTTDESLGVVADPTADRATPQDVQAKTVLAAHTSPAVPGPSSAQPEPS